MVWALSGDAPVADVNEYAVLGCMAETADRDGCGTWQSKETIASRVHVSEETVKRCWRNMRRRGLIAKGDQSLVKHYRADRRPVVYDLLIPYDWFSNIERTNAERARLGREPLTPENRPPIAPAQPKKQRADKGASRPKRTPSDQEGPERGNSETPRGKTSETPHGGTASHRRGNCKSSTGGLVDPQTSTFNPTTEPVASPVLPSIREPDARASKARTGEERTDGGEVEQQETQGPGVPVASQGVELLVELGRREPRMALAGKVLSDQGALVEGLLAVGWSWSALLNVLGAPLPEKITRSVGAVIAKRIELIPACPPVQRDPSVLPAGVPAPRTVEQELESRSQHECQGRDGECGRQVPTKGALCSACKKPCSAGCGRGPAEPARRDGLCRGCIQDEADAALPRCLDGCGRPAVRSDGRCPACHREETGRRAEEQELAQAREALAALLGTESAGAPS
ncbi:hypothetical protein [Kitasatospora kifunensis]|uniref:Helix-turn-helix domain-containing protein n=1 Tax=Kitasatospora kifunensis TaxID=58351 RepID=A0A7W7RAE4_KITKI|nr:hypothetical protein [Kitasatospora kifunensis]MBB4928299.1 hypothetical protein [Kitasatospora kifunensis]